MVTFPFWPESQYLVRMANVVPAVVADVIQSIPLNDNYVVLNDFIRAALVMPPELAIKLSNRVIEWVNAHDTLPDPLAGENLGQLILHLANGGEITAALELAKSVLAISPDPRAAEKRRDRFGLPLEPRARIDLWGYKILLNKVCPQLVSVAEEEALTILCDLLEQSITFSTSDSTEKPPEDYSYIWHPNIESTETHRDSVKNLLIPAVRDAAIHIALAAPDSINKLVEDLESRQWRVFQRLALHLLRLIPNKALITARIIDKSLFDDMDVVPEYKQLLQAQFLLLEPEQQRTYLNWVEAGPNIDSEAFKDSREAWFGKRPSDQDYETYVKAWKRDRLAIVRSSLKGQWQEYLDRLIAELGEPELIESYESFAADVIVDQSPKSPEELASMDARDIIIFLKEWKASREADSATQVGLANTLSSLAASEPNKFAQVADQFSQLNPIYIRALLTGIRQAVDNNKRFDWGSILELTQFVVTQTATENNVSAALPKEQYGLSQTKREVASLFVASLKVAEAGIPFEFRPFIWKVIEPLTHDPDPTPEVEARYGGSNMDPATLSLNTNRGEAMHAIIRYALWVRQHFERATNAEVLLSAGFAQMPEVCEVLDYHLEMVNDPALSIRAVYGQWFPWLSLLDNDWAAKSADRIFPAEETLSDFWFAAWQTYVVFCAPYDSVFDILQKEYHRAVDRIGQQTKWKMIPGNPDRRLVEHIITLYWRGKIELNEPEGLLTRLLNKAPDNLRGHAIGFIGRSLCNTKEPVPGLIIERLKDFWSLRLSVHKNAETSSRGDELSEFGWWFISGKFDDAWSVANLREALSITGLVEPDHEVAERLATIAESAPLAAVECIYLMTKHVREQWRMYAISKSIRTILEIAMKGADEKVRRLAEDTINRLLAQGHFEYRDLLL